MVLQSSGAISASQVNTEITRSATALFSMNDTTVRTLAGKTTANSLIGFSDFYGKSLSAAGTAQWVAAVDGGTSAYKVAIDSSNNVYVAGSYAGTATVYNAGNVSSGFTFRQVTFSSQNNGGGFIIKYDSTGTYQWAVSVEYANVRSVAVDTSGNVYMCGTYNPYNVRYSFQASANIYNPNNVNSNLSLRPPVLAGTYSTSAAFVVKYNSNGMAQWAASVESECTGMSVAVDASGNVYLGGEYRYTPTIYNANNTNSGLALRTSAGRAGFVVKYNSSGTAQMFLSVDSGNTDSGGSIAVDASGNIYMSGFSYYSPATIYNANNVSSGLSLRAPSTTTQGFVVKWNASGTAQWAAVVDTNSFYGQTFMTLDNNENVYLAGDYANATNSGIIYNAGGVSSGLILRTPTGGSAVFVVKYNSSGAAQWAVSMDGTSSEYVYDVAVDSNGNVLFCGEYNSTDAILYNAGNTNSGLTLRTPTGNSAGYVALYNASGTAQWVASIDGASIERAFGVAVKQTNVYVCGTSGATATIYNKNNVSSGLTLAAPSSGTNAFVVKII